MPVYIYKGGKKRYIGGTVVQNRGDEVELDSLEGIVDANRFILKPITIKKIKPTVPLAQNIAKEPEIIKPEVKIKGGNN